MNDLPGRFHVACVVNEIQEHDTHSIRSGKSYKRNGIQENKVSRFHNLWIFVYVCIKGERQAAITTVARQPRLHSNSSIVPTMAMLAWKLPLEAAVQPPSSVIFHFPKHKRKKATQISIHDDQIMSSSHMYEVYYTLILTPHQIRLCKGVERIEIRAGSTQVYFYVMSLNKQAGKQIQLRRFAQHMGLFHSNLQRFVQTAYANPHAPRAHPVYVGKYELACTMKCRSIFPIVVPPVNAIKHKNPVKCELHMHCLNSIALNRSVKGNVPIVQLMIPWACLPEIAQQMLHKNVLESKTGYMPLSGQVWRPSPSAPRSRKKGRGKKRKAPAKKKKEAQSQQQARLLRRFNMDRNDVNPEVEAFMEIDYDLVRVSFRADCLASTDANGETLECWLAPVFDPRVVFVFHDLHMRCIKGRNEQHQQKLFIEPPATPSCHDVYKEPLCVREVEEPVKGAWRQFSLVDDVSRFTSWFTGIVTHFGMLCGVMRYCKRDMEEAWMKKAPPCLMLPLTTLQITPDPSLRKSFCPVTQKRRRIMEEVCDGEETLSPLGLVE